MLRWLVGSVLAAVGFIRPWSRYDLPETLDSPTQTLVPSLRGDVSALGARKWMVTAGEAVGVGVWWLAPIWSLGEQMARDGLPSGKSWSRLVRCLRAAREEFGRTRPARRDRWEVSTCCKFWVEFCKNQRTTQPEGGSDWEASSRVAFGMFIVRPMWCREACAEPPPLPLSCCSASRVCTARHFLLFPPMSSRPTGCSSSTWCNRSMVSSGALETKPQHFLTLIFLTLQMLNYEYFFLYIFFKKMTILH